MGSRFFSLTILVHKKCNTFFIINKFVIEKNALVCAHDVYPFYRNILFDSQQMQYTYKTEANAFEYKFRTIYQSII